MAAPVRNTCPDVDKAKQHLKYATKIINQEMQERVMTAQILYSLEEAGALLETVRDHNAILRHWGEGLEENVHEAGIEIAMLEARIQIHEKMWTDCLQQAKRYKFRYNVSCYIGAILLLSLCLIVFL